MSTLLTLSPCAFAGVLLACASQGTTASNTALGAALVPGSVASDRAARDTSSVAVGGEKSIERLFTGRFAGVDVRASATGGVQIRIRGGVNSFVATQEPLYVVDGTPLPAGTGEISWLNPYDIEKIEVLKNPPDITVYGARGSNGVIRITTRRPGRR